MTAASPASAKVSAEGDVCCPNFIGFCIAQPENPKPIAMASAVPSTEFVNLCDMLTSPSEMFASVLPFPSDVTVFWTCESNPTSPLLREIFWLLVKQGQETKSGNGKPLPLAMLS